MELMSRVQIPAETVHVLFSIIILSGKAGIDISPFSDVKEQSFLSWLTTSLKKKKRKKDNSKFKTLEKVTENNSYFSRQQS